GSWMGLKGGTYIEMLAARWNRATDIYFEHQDSIMLVRYEDFLADKPGTIQNLAEHLNIPGINDISAKLDHPFEPPGNRTIPWIEFFGQENLLRIDQLCAVNMDRLEYHPSQG